MKQIAFIVIIALRLAYNPATENKSLSAFGQPSNVETLAVLPGESIKQTGSSERLILKWIIGDNRPATCYKSVNEFYDFNSNTSGSFGVKGYNSVAVQQKPII